MASKVETRASIVSLSKELNLEVPADLEQIDKLVDLEALLKSLEDKKAALAPPIITPAVTKVAGADGASEEGAGGPPPPPSFGKPDDPKKVVATTYVINEGKSLQTLRGHIGALEHVWPNDFKGGHEDLDHWVVNGFVTKTEHYEQ